MTEPLATLPTHHLHISTGFMFVVALLILGLVALLIWALRKPAPVVDQVKTTRTSGEYAAAARGYRQSATPTEPRSYASSAPSYASVGAPTIINAGSGNDMLTGVLIGEALAGSHHSAPVYVEPTPVYDAPAYDPGFTYDTGPSSSCGDTGGFSFDW